MVLPKYTGQIGSRVGYTPLPDREIVANRSAPASFVFLRLLERDSGDTDTRYLAACHRVVVPPGNLQA